MILAEALKLYCKKYKISAYTLEGWTGVSHDTISRFLRGETIRSDHFLKLLNWATQEQK